MFQACRISWQDVTKSDKYSLLSYVVFSCSSTPTARSLRAQDHISGKTTFRTLCAGAHKMRESRPPGSVRGASSNGCPYRDSPREWSQRSEFAMFNTLVLAPNVVASEVD